ncbi:hypothetical protein Aoki45_40030 [Algoriphagus sp. oki45]|nr:hypothetical protein Aoki45_40030 [Algoriphagus sp. oki45]
MFLLVHFSFNMLLLNHNRFYFRILLLFSLFTGYSCKKVEQIRKNQMMSSFDLIKEKEFLIHSITSVELLDYFPKEKLYLGYSNTNRGKEILLVDENGKVIISENMQGEGPEQHSSSFSSIGFSDEGNIWVMTSVEVLLYDRNLKLIDRFKYQPIDILYLYSLAKKFSYFNLDSFQNQITFATIPSGTSRFNPLSGNNFDQLMLFELYDRKSSTLRQFSPLSERQVTKEFLGLVGGFYSPVYDVNSKSSKLILTSSFDNQITIHDLSEGMAFIRIPILYEDPNSLPFPNKLKPEDLFQTPEGWLLSPKNQSIHQLDDDLFVLEYLSGVTINPFKKNQPEIDENPTQNRLILFNYNDQLSKDILIPERGVLMTTLPGNRLLVKSVDPKREDDFTRYLVYRIEEDASFSN